MECGTSRDNDKSLKDSNPEAAVILQEIDPKVPIGILREILGKRLGNSDLSKHDIYIQQVQLDPVLSLYEQGVKVEDKVTVSVQIQTSDLHTKLVIVDIVESPTPVAARNRLNNKPATKRKYVFTNNSTEEKASDTGNELGIPGNPILWNKMQVHQWMVWVAKEFGFDTSVIKFYGVDGQGLNQMSQSDFITKFPYGNILWSHLELLKKLVFHPGDQEVTNDLPTTNSDNVTLEVGSMIDTANNFSATKRSTTYNRMAPGNRSGNNGQIQLWQFLLEMLTDADCINCIRWIGDSGEFKLLDPETVAQKWGERKNKPAMNYEKLSRALRYYYDGEMISKVPGKRFVYKFVRDLKLLVGYSAADLHKLVIDCADRRRNAVQALNVDEFLQNPKKDDVAWR